MALAIAELIKDAELVNTEIECYQKVTKESIQKYCQKVLVKENSSTLYYKSKNK